MCSVLTPASVSRLKGIFVADHQGGTGPFRENVLFISRSGNQINRNKIKAEKKSVALDTHIV